MSANVTITGRLGADPVLRFTQNGTAVASWNMVTERRVKDDAGEWSSVDQTWWSCSAWAQLAETCTEELQKGDAVIVTGRMHVREYETKDGDKRRSLDLHVWDVGKNLRFRKPKERQTQPQQDQWSKPQEQEAPF